MRRSVNSVFPQSVPFAWHQRCIALLLKDEIEVGKTDGHEVGMDLTQAGSMVHGKHILATSVAGKGGTVLLSVNKEHTAVFRILMVTGWAGKPRELPGVAAIGTVQSTLSVLTYCCQMRRTPTNRAIAFSPGMGS